MSRRVREFVHARGGVSAIEFAIVAPVFILLLVGILAYGLYFGLVHSVQQLAADAARAAVAGLTAEERRSIAEARVASGAETYMLIRPDQLVTVAEEGGADSFAVRLTYDASHLGIWGLDGLLPLPSPVIRRAAVIRRGGY